MRIHDYFSEPRGVCEQKSLGKHRRKELLNFKYLGGAMLAVLHLVAHGNWQRVNPLMMHSFQGFSSLPFGFSWLNINLITWKHFKVLVKKRPKWQLISGTTLLSTIIHKLYHYNSRLAVGVKCLYLWVQFFVLWFMGFTAFLMVYFDLIRSYVSETVCVVCTNYMVCWNRHFIMNTNKYLQGCISRNWYMAKLNVHYQ